MKFGIKRKMEERKLNKYDKAYLRIAKEWSLLSYCKRKQVGAIIVKDRMIISDGYNGTPSGFENCCEDEEGLTRWDALHAEANAILKVARSTQSCEGATLYITLSPCKECSKLIHQSGIKRVVYHNGYRDDSGLQFLKKAGIEVEHIAELVEK
jgi:dCMP deaminase